MDLFDDEGSTIRLPRDEVAVGTVLVQDVEELL